MQKLHRQQSPPKMRKYAKISHSSMAFYILLGLGSFMETEESIVLLCIKGSQMRLICLCNIIFIFFEGWKVGRGLRLTSICHVKL